MKLFQKLSDRTQMSQSNSIIEKLKNNIKLNEEIIIVNLKEFFGTYLSNFLKEYRVSIEPSGDELKQILAQQDEIYQNLQNLMKLKNSSNSQKSNSISELEDYAKNQRQIIVLIKEFFTSNSKFMKLYRTASSLEYEKMNKLLDEQLHIFNRLESYMKNS